MKSTDPPQRDFAGQAISALTPVGKDAARTSVRCGRRSVALIPTTLVQELDLRIGRMLTGELIARLRHVAEVEKARSAALRLVNARPYSKKRLGDRLKKRGFDAEVARAVVERLVDTGLLDDREYGRELIRQTTATRPAGHRLLRSKLIQHGLDRLLIDELLDEALADAPAASEDPELIRLVERKLASMRQVDAPTRARRLFGFLARRGFDPEEVRLIVDRYVRLDG